MEYGPLTPGRSYSQDLSPCKELPRNTGESEGQCSSVGVQGAGPWSQRSAPPSPSAEGWREVRREEGNQHKCMLLFFSTRIRPPPRPRHGVQELGLDHGGPLLPSRH